MANNDKIPMKILRTYPRSSGTYPKGHVFHATPAQAKSMEEANPPYGERITKTEAKELDSTPAPIEKPSTSKK